MSRFPSDAWGVKDFVGHGTQLACLSLFGDLTVALQNMTPSGFSID